MSAPPSTNTGAEREIDLSRWRNAVLQWWWIPVLGLIGGAIVGALYGVAGGSVYQASVLIAPAQPFGPNGAPVLNYISTPHGIQQIVNEQTTLQRAANAAGIGVDRLKNNVTVQTIPTGVSISGQARGSSLVKIVVQLHNGPQAEAAANNLGKTIIQSTESDYVKLSLISYATKIKSYQSQIAAAQNRINAYNKTLADKSLTGIDRLSVVNQQSNVEQLLAQYQDELSTAQQQLTLANTLEIARIVGPRNATAAKTTARSRRTSILFGAIIGLILGLIVAIVVDARASRARRA
jgi:hypothetical protein